MKNQMTVDTTPNQTGKNRVYANQQGRVIPVQMFTKKKDNELVKVPGYKKPENIPYFKKLRKIADNLIARYGGETNMRNSIVRALSWNDQRYITYMIEERLKTTAINRCPRAMFMDLTRVLNGGPTRKIISRAEDKRTTIQSITNIHINQKIFKTDTLTRLAIKVAGKHMKTPGVSERLLRNFAEIAMLDGEMRLLHALEKMDNIEQDAKTAEKYLKRTMKENNKKRIQN